LAGEHTERKHCKVSGSNIKRLRRCPAQARMARAVGRAWDNSEDAAEGTTRHELLEVCLLDGVDLAKEDPRWTQERFNAILGVITYVEKIRAAFPDLQVFCEQDVRFPQDVIPRDDCGGNADVVCYSESARRGWLIDFKSGVTEVDDPAENDQVWFYATAFFWGIPLEQLTLVIIQPNGLGVDEVREHTTDPLALVAFAADIRALLLRSEASDAVLVPGAWCTGCSVGSECGAREREVIGALTGSPGTSFSLLVDELPKPEDLSIDRWVDIRRKKAFIVSFLNAIDDAAFVFAMRGGRLPGEKLVEAGARRVWLGTPQEAAAGVAAITGADPASYLTVEMTGITKAEAEVKAVAKKSPNPKGVHEKFSLLTNKVSSGKLTLAPIEDARPEYNPARVAFAGVVPESLLGA